MTDNDDSRINIFKLIIFHRAFYLIADIKIKNLAYVFIIHECG